MISLHVQVHQLDGLV